MTRTAHRANAVRAAGDVSSPSARLGLLHTRRAMRSPNNHVVDKAESVEVPPTTASLYAEVIGTDSKTDIALIKV